MVYDALLILAIWLVTLFVLVALADSAVAGPLVQSILFLELVAFFAYFWMFRGQTLGMLAWRLSIESATGYRLTFTQVLFRLLGAAAGSACLGIGYLWLYVDPARRTWPDLLSDSMVYYTPKDAAKA